MNRVIAIDIEDIKASQETNIRETLRKCSVGCNYVNAWEMSCLEKASDFMWRNCWNSSKNITYNVVREKKWEAEVGGTKVVGIAVSKKNRIYF